MDVNLTLKMAARCMCCSCAAVGRLVELPGTITVVSDSRHTEVRSRVFVWAWRHAMLHLLLWSVTSHVADARECHSYITLFVPLSILPLSRHTLFGNVHTCRGVHDKRMAHYLRSLY